MCSGGVESEDGGSGEMSLPARWYRFLELARQRLRRRGDDEGSAERSAHEACEEYMRHGRLKWTCRAALERSDFFWACFYVRLGERKGYEGLVTSPVGEEGDSSWMLSSDYAFLNARATSLHPSGTGDFIQAMKLPPVMRVSSIHLAPFFDCNFSNLYCLDSLSMLAADVVDRDYALEGLDGDEQLRLLVDAVHMLGKTIGFDLEPHTAQFSRVALARPWLFRWLRLSEDRKELYGGVSQEEMLDEEAQRRLREEVAAIVERVFSAHGIADPRGDGLEDADPDAVRNAHREAISTLIAEGYWTLPSHTWSGVGLPRFSSYNEQGGYPEFEYLDEKGEDQKEHAFGMLTPYRFYDGLPVNEVPADKPRRCDDVVEFFKEIFPRVRRKYGFDFVRLDYVDHVFDSVVGEDDDYPVSDRITPVVLREVVESARRDAPFVGVMAERMGVDVDVYGKAGVDLLLGIEVLTTIHSGYLEDLFSLNEKITRWAGEAGRPCSVMWAVDTHDSGHPLFWTRAVSQAVGARGMNLRHFVCRFANIGGVRRPKYECMGNQDLSYGLYFCNNNARSLTWVGDEEYCRMYHRLEDVYEHFRPFLERGRVSAWNVQEKWAWWAIDSEHEPGERLVCLVALEKKYENLKEVGEKDGDFYRPVVIDEFDALEGRDGLAVAYAVDLFGWSGTDGGVAERQVELIDGRRMPQKRIEPRGIRLYRLVIG